MIKVPTDWIQSLQAKAETGMGFQTTTILLKDGRSFKRVVIFNCELIETTDFVSEDIQAIIVTHQ